MKCITINDIICALLLIYHKHHKKPKYKYPNKKDANKLRLIPQLKGKLLPPSVHISNKDAVTIKAGVFSVVNFTSPLISPSPTGPHTISPPIDVPTVTSNVEEPVNLSIPLDSESVASAIEKLPAPSPPSPTVSYTISPSLDVPTVALTVA